MAQTGMRKEADGFTPAQTWTIGIVAVLVMAAMLFGLWKGQFAAPPTYLFGTPTQGAEAGYCLAVAQDVVPGGAPIGSYMDEAVKFWIKRMRAIEAPMGESIAAGRAKLSADMSVSGKSTSDWLENAMDMCSNRALMYGARFKAFE